MKTNLLIIFTLLSYSVSSAASNSTMVLTKPNADINVVVNNFCEYFAQIIICNGADSLGIEPSLGSGNCPFDPRYTHYDSLYSISGVKFLEQADDGSTPWSTKPLFIGNETTILSYNTTYGNYWCDTIFISPNDTLHSDSIAGIQVWPWTGLIVIRNTSSSPNFLLYDTTFSLVFSLQLNMRPVFLSGSSVIGINQNNETVLNIIDLFSQQVELDTIMGVAAQNPFSFKYISSQQLLLASQPGDSMVCITKYNYSGNVLVSDTLFTGSGINVGTWEGPNFHYQPHLDTSANGFDRQVIIYNCNNMVQSGVFNIDKRLKKLVYPAATYYNGYPYVNVVTDSLPTKVYAYQSSDYLLADSFETGLNPSLFSCDFRCPVKVTEYDDSKVEWKVYPNPSTGDFKLTASGLICGRDYKIDIIDEQGKVIYETTARAKMTLVLPTSRYKAGIYFVRIHTLKGYITQEIIKQ